MIFIRDGHQLQSWQTPFPDVFLRINQQIKAVRLLVQYSKKSEQEMIPI